MSLFLFLRWTADNQPIPYRVFDSHQKVSDFIDGETDDTERFCVIEFEPTFRQGC